MDNPAFAVDAKKEEFRQYIERAGITDAITKALVMLYEENDKPEDPLAYFRNALSTMADDRMTALEQQLAKLKEENQELREKLEEARVKEEPM